MCDIHGTLIEMSTESRHISFRFDVGGEKKGRYQKTFACGGGTGCKKRMKKEEKDVLHPSFVIVTVPKKDKEKKALEQGVSSSQKHREKTSCPSLISLFCIPDCPFLQ